MTFVLGICIGEMLANITQARCTQHGASQIAVQGPHPRRNAHEGHGYAELQCRQGPVAMPTASRCTS